MNRPAHINMHPPSEILAVLAAVVLAAIASFGGTLLQTAQEVSVTAQQAAETAQQISNLQELSETTVLMWCLFGGVIGGGIALMFDLIPNDKKEEGKWGREAIKGFVGSVFFAFGIGPWAVSAMQLAPNIRNVLVVAVVLGISASIVMIRLVPKLLPILVRLAPPWFLQVIGVKTGLDVSPYEEELKPKPKLRTPPSDDHWQ